MGVRPLTPTCRRHATSLISLIRKYCLSSPCETPSAKRAERRLAFPEAGAPRGPQRPGPGDAGISPHPPLPTWSSPASAWDRPRPRCPHLSREQVSCAPASSILGSSRFEGAVIVTACKDSVPGRAARTLGADASADAGRWLHAGAQGSTSSLQGTLAWAGEGTGHAGSWECTRFRKLPWGEGRQQAEAAGGCGCQVELTETVGERRWHLRRRSSRLGAEVARRSPRSVWGAGRGGGGSGGASGFIRGSGLPGGWCEQRARQRVVMASPWTLPCPWGPRTHGRASLTAPPPAVPASKRAQ